MNSKKRKFLPGRKKLEMAAWKRGLWYADLKDIQGKGNTE